jgi:conjugal transfer mating pair stabilization protein TraN
MYDAMFASDIPWQVDRAVDEWSATAWTSTTSFYGLQFSFSSTSGLQFVGFDPYLFMISVAIMVIQEMLSCEQPEQLLAFSRCGEGAGMAHQPVVFLTPLTI